MRRSEARPPVRHPGRLLLWGAVALLFALFGTLTAYQLVYRDQIIVDAERQQELSQTTLSSSEPRTSEQDWPQWRGPQRDGVSTETGLLTDWPEGGPRRLWEQPTGEGFASVVVARGRAFTLLQDGPNEALVCWDAATGQERWRFAYPCRYKNQFGNGPRATPTLAGEFAYLVSGSGLMHCVKAFGERPELVWKKDLMREFGASIPEWGVAFSPLVEDGRVYIQPGGPDGNSVAALEPATGAILWKRHNYPPSYSSPLAATIAGRRQIIFFTGTHLIGVTPEKGDLLWEHPWETFKSCNIATPIVARDYVFISSGYQMGCAMLKIEPHGSAWQANLVYKNQRLRSHFSSPVRHGEHIYGFDDTNLVCLDFRTGKVCWKERGYGKGSLLAAEGRLIIHGETGVVALVDADPAEFRERARFNFSEQGSACWTAPALADGRLYIRDQQKIACFEMKQDR